MARIRDDLKYLKFSSIAPVEGEFTTSVSVFEVWVVVVIVSPGTAKQQQKPGHLISIFNNKGNSNVTYWKVFKVSRLIAVPRLH